MRYSEIPTHDLNVVGVVVWVAATALALWGIYWYSRCRLGLGLAVSCAIGARVVVWAAHVLGLPLPDDSVDALAFERTAWALVAGPRGAPVYGAYGYSWALSFVYQGIGRVPHLLQLVNVVSGSAIVVLAAMVARRVHGSRSMHATAWIVALFPTLVLYSVVLMREAPIVLALLSLVLLALEFLLRPQAFLAAAAAAVAYVPAWLQTGFRYIGPSVGMAVVVGLAWSRNWPRKWLLFCGALVAVLFGTYLAVDVGGGAIAGEHVVADAQDERTRGRAAYPGWMVLDSVLDVPWLLPLRVLMLLFAPFPWMVDTGLDVLGLFDALAYAVIVAALAAILCRGQGSSRLALVLFVAAVGVAVYSMGTSNYGTGVRHRAKFAPLLVALAAPQLDAWRVQALEWICLQGGRRPPKRRTD